MLDSAPLCAVGFLTVYVTCSYSGQLKSRKAHMVPENEFHYKEPASTANPGALQNGPGSSGKPGTSTPASANTGKSEEGAAEDTGEFCVGM